MEKIDTKDRYEIGFYIHEYAQTEGFAILPHDKRAEYDNVLTPEKKKKLVDMRLRDYSITSEKHGIKINIKHVDIDKLLDVIYRRGLSSHIVRYLIHGLITS